jgi:hypothetical protein
MTARYRFADRRLRICESVMAQTEKATSWQVGLAAGWPQGRGKWARRASRSEG